MFTQAQVQQNHSREQQWLLLFLLYPAELHNNPSFDFDTCLRDHGQEVKNFDFFQRNKKKSTTKCRRTAGTMENNGKFGRASKPN